MNRKGKDKVFLSVGLIVLKRYISKLSKLKGDGPRITEQAKIINSFITTSMIRNNGDRIIVRILREILTILIGHQYRYWMPLD